MAKLIKIDMSDLIKKREEKILNDAERLKKLEGFVLDILADGDIPQWIRTYYERQLDLLLKEFDGLKS
jgi:hypothetical protein